VIQQRTSIGQFPGERIAAKIRRGRFNAKRWGDSKSNHREEFLPQRDKENINRSSRNLPQAKQRQLKKEKARNQILAFSLLFFLLSL
jgi:hypothetical protein